MSSPRLPRRPKPYLRRALALLAGCGSGGCTEHVMRMHGFTADQLAELVRFGFVATTTERAIREHDDDNCRHPLAHFASPCRISASAELASRPRYQRRIQHHG